MAWELSFRPFPAADSPVELARVPWDSDLLGCEVFELRLPAGAAEAATGPIGLALRELARDGHGLVYAKVPVGQVAVTQALTQAGFYLVEAGIELEVELDRLRPAWGDRELSLPVRLAEESDLATLRSIARTGLTKDRYHLDPNVSRDRADERIASWVERGWRDGETTWLFEHPDAASAVGFFQFRDWPRETAYMSLASVQESYRQSGLGMVIVEQSLTRLRDAGYRRAVARSSLNNLDVVQMCSALGFTLRDAWYTLHASF